MKVKVMTGNEFCIIGLGFETEIFLIENCTKIIDSFSKLSHRKLTSISHRLK